VSPYTGNRGQEEVISMPAKKKAAKKSAKKSAKKKK
jgi:hypothetical protein